MKMRLLFLCGSALILDACSTNPIAEDQLPVLTGDQGIAAVSFESTVGVTSVELIPVTGQGGKLHIPEVPLGDSVFLFVTPAGRYCINQYYFNSHYFTAKEHNQCFEVQQGKLSYSGTFSPTMSLMDQVLGGNDMHGGMAQNDNPRAFLNALNLQYPNIAAQAFPTGSDRSVGELAPPPNSPEPTGLCDLLTVAQATELLGKDVKPGTEWTLGNLTSCNYLHSDDESVHIQFVACGDQNQYLADNFGKEALMTGGIMQPIKGFPGNAGVASKDHNYELNVALQDRLAVLIVDGTRRDDIVQAMITTMHQLLPNLKPMPAKPCA